MTDSDGERPNSTDILGTLFTGTVGALLVLGSYEGGLRPGNYWLEEGIGLLVLVFVIPGFRRTMRTFLDILLIIISGMSFLLRFVVPMLNQGS